MDKDFQVSELEFLKESEAMSTISSIMEKLVLFEDISSII